MLNPLLSSRPDLTTWQEIATYLGVSIGTAQKYERELGLPVRRLTGGPKGRVVAKHEELDAWMEARLAQSLPEKSLELKEELRSRRKPFHWVAAIVACLAGAGLTVYWLRPIRKPVTYRVEVGTLITLDAQGEEVFRHVFPRELIIYEPRRAGSVAFADVDGDGEVETIFPYSPEDRSKGDIVYCFSQSGKEKWHFSPGRAEVPDENGDRNRAPYWINSVQAIPDPGGRRYRIAISSNHHSDAPDQIAILNSRGQMTGEFWHPGHLLHMAEADLNHDGLHELLAGGVNNSNHAATLLVFDPAHVAGTSQYFTDKRFQLSGFGPGTQKAAILFPRTCVSRRKAYNRVFEIGLRSDTIFVGVVEDVAEASMNAILYRLDYNLNVLAADPSQQYQAAHHQMYRSGELDHELTAKEMEGWKQAVKVIRP